MFPRHSKPPHMSDAFNPSSQNTSHSLYHNMQASSDFSPIPDNDIQKAEQMGSYSAGPYPPSSSFNAFASNRPRHGSTVSSGPYREPSSFRQSFASPEPMGPPSFSQLAGIHSQSPPQGAFEPIHHQSRGAFDFPGSMGASSVGPHHKQSYTNLDAFGSGVGPSLFSTKPGLNPNGHGQSQPRNFQSAPQYAVNGLHSMQSQTPFGPHLPANGGTTPATPITAPTVTHMPNNAQGPSQEEISTIFVVGFPDDMQEREFQNMFTFAQGFEAATLKIPNKELTSYGSGAGPLRASYSQGFSGPNDPYNLVTVNQGGVLVDGGRDGTTASWPAAPVSEDGQFMQNPSSTIPPRKQIIGFAKFSSRAEALTVRDQLQGRRVDAEKGAVLKAEMAKKNLHTKRGVGQSGIPGTGMPQDMLNGMTATPGGGEALAARERELGALGAMGIRRDRMMVGEDDLERTRRRDAEPGMMPSLTALGTRGPRERAEDDERRKMREKERLRSHSSAFEAFHSVPQHLLRSQETPVQDSAFLNGGSEGFAINASANPWAMPLRESSTHALNPLASRRSEMGYGQPVPSGSSTHSPPVPQAFPSSSSQSSQSGLSDFEAPSDLGASMSPAAESYLPAGLTTRSRARSPSVDSQSAQIAQPSSAAGSPPFAGSQRETDAALSQALADLAVGAHGGTEAQVGTTSPQLPSPASNASSTGRTNPADQNPPINTLYVGNLPASPTQAGYPSSHLEDGLRDLFSHQPGYRKLSFRQKSNGPMCFVEFDDVSFAARALNDLYGHNLNGLVKGGGIRLSYSKNPLGVRTPTSATQASTPSSAAFSPEVFQPRQSFAADMDATPRRDPLTSYSYTMAQAPPRFASPSGFNPLTSTFPRASAPAFSPTGATPTFSPFATSSPRPIPERSAAESNDAAVSALSPVTATST